METKKAKIKDNSIFTATTVMSVGNVIVSTYLQSLCPLI
jgi:hypothetical protein